VWEARNKFWTAVAETLNKNEDLLGSPQGEDGEPTKYKANDGIYISIGRPAKYILESLGQFGYTIIRAYQCPKCLVLSKLDREMKTKLRYEIPARKGKTVNEIWKQTFDPIKENQEFRLGPARFECRA
jgi:hypothetical protein